MDKNITLKETADYSESVKQICDSLFHIFEKMKKINGMYDSTVEKHQRLCTIIPKQIDKGSIKIAVVGAIKSGKSTFINSLLMDDILKRGAGVVTSVLTRVKRGDTLKAEIIFKSWDEINNDIEKTLMLTPSLHNSEDSNSYSSSVSNFSSSLPFGRSGFDLRRKKDRNFLKTVKSTLCFTKWSEDGFENNEFKNIGCKADPKTNNSLLRSEAILITNVLDGYENVKEFIQSERAYVEFTGKQFSEHKQFTGISSNAFFVKDVVLHVPQIDNGIEIADCQGSDSTDSSHISYIQDYLLTANIVIYIISSRTGLREADVKFFSIIKKIGILNNLFFILNADFNEHDSFQSLLNIEKSVKQEIGYFVEAPVIYTISSLFNLLCALEERETTFLSLQNSPIASDQSGSAKTELISDKESAMLSLWQEENDLIKYTTQTFKEFEKALKNKIEKERFSTILENHIERLKVVIQAAWQRNSMFMQLLSDDLQQVADAAQKLQQLQEQSKRFESSVDSSIEIAVKTIKRDIKSAITIFFDKKRGIQAVNVRNFILGVEIYNEQYQNFIENFGFNHALYCMFRDFRNKLDIFMAQQFNSAVVQFIQEQEQLIEKEFEALYQSYCIEPSTVYPFTALSNKHDKSSIKKVDLNGAKRILGLTMPKSSFATAYSANIRADAMARFSFYSFMEFLGKFIRSFTVTYSSSRALQESAKKIRNAAIRSVMSHFETYLNHIQDGYIFPLVDAIARNSKEKMMEMFQACAVESKNIEQLISDECVDKSDQLKHVKDIALSLNLIIDNQLKTRIMNL